MKISAFILSVLLSSIAFSQSAEEIIKKAEDKLRGTTSYAEMKITTIRPKWEREMTIKTWTKGDDYSVTLVTSPAKDKGTVFLKRDKEIWQYIPSIERTIKMPPSMLTQSWMGTDLKNDDLLQESSLKEDYEKEKVGMEKIEGLDCFKLKLTPKKEVNSIWGKILIWISKDSYLQMKTEFYDEDNELVNTILGKQPKQIGGKLLPSIMEVIPADKKGQKTRMVYQKAEFDLEIDDKIFTRQYMKRLK